MWSGSAHFDGSCTRFFRFAVLEALVRLLHVFSMALFEGFPVCLAT